MTIRHTLCIADSAHSASCFLKRAQNGIFMRLIRDTPETNGIFFKI